jgi:hypothetical protein
MSRALTKTLSTEPDMKALWKMLQTMRPAGSRTEEQFISDWIAPLGTYEDDYGNHILRIGTAPIMWSSHTDTVHRQEGIQRITQKAGLVKLSESEQNASCLGADCTAGVWLMRELILANVEGLYVFHREEEIGGFGSQWIAKHTPELVDGILACIALDRKGTDSIITHQAGGRTASDAFAASLGKMLPAYKKDETGLFTDSANYAHACEGFSGIPECTNLSIGYENAHSASETLAYLHLLDVRDWLIRLDWRKLAIQRKPEPKQARSYRSALWALDNWEDEDSGQWARSDGEARSVYDFVLRYPEETADLLEQYGIGLDDLYGSAPYRK